MTARCLALIAPLLLASGGLIAQMSVYGAWSQKTTAATWSARGGHTLTAHNGKLWLIGGSDFAAPFNDVWSSPNGANWTHVSTAPMDKPQRPRNRAAGRTAVRVRRVSQCGCGVGIAG